jgi:hypothetical protein
VRNFILAKVMQDLPVSEFVSRECCIPDAEVFGALQGISFGVVA